jgi:hypothetical protein
MYSPNAAWVARTDAGAKHPIYFLAIEGLGTKHFSTGPVLNAVVVKRLLLQLPDSVGQRLAQLTGRSSLTLTNISLLDRDGEITELVATERSAPLLGTLINRRVTIFSGYADLREDEYAPVFEGAVDSLELGADNVTYTLRIVDLRRAAQDDIMTNAKAQSPRPINTTLSASASAGAFSFSVVDPTGIADNDYMMLGPNASGQEERIFVGSVNATAINVGSDVVAVAPSPLQFSYAAGNPVRWATTKIEGNPINIIHAVLTGDFAAALFPVTSSGLPTGLGVSPSDIDVEAFARERDMFAYGETLRFEFKQAQSGFRFLETRIYRLIGFSAVTVDGRITFRTFRPAFAADAVAGLPQIEKSDMISWEWVRAHDLHVNKVVLGIDLDPETGAPANRVTYEDAADQTTTGETSSIEEDDTGLVVSLRGLAHLETRARALLRRYTLPPVQLKITGHLSMRRIEVGDDVEVTHAEIPNSKTGFRGITKGRFVVVERIERFRESEVYFLLQEAEFFRPAAWAPDAQAGDYSTASATEKEYACWGPDSGNFPDGGSPYEWV